MADPHFDQHSLSGSLPEVPPEGLVLWRLHSFDDEWWCTVENFADQLVLRVHTPDESRTALTETFDIAAAVVARADALCAQYLTQGWNLRDASQPTAAPDTESAILSVWFAAPNWEVTGVQCQETAEISPSAIMGKPPLGRLLSPELVSTVEAALAAAATGSRQVLYFKAIRDGGRVDFRRGVLFGDSERVRMDVFETTEAVAGRSAVEVDLRA